jgi:hypothetical protein
VVVELPWLRLAGKTWWPSTLLPQVIVLGTVAALGGALLGGSVGRARAAWRPVVVAIGAPTLLLLPLLGHGSVVPVRDHWPTRTATVSFTGRVVSLTVDRAESTDWISLFRQSGRPGQPSRWVGGATWHGHGVFEGSVKSSPFAVGIWFVSGDQVYGNRVALGSTSHEVSLYRVTSARSQPPPRWARPAVSIVLAAVLLLALALASRLLVPEPDPVVTAERLSR